jgi:hypothetical protein
VARGDNAELAVRHQLHILGKPITSPRDGDDVLVILRAGSGPTSTQRF